MHSRTNSNQPIESRISTLETEFQSFAVSTTQRFDSFDARQTAIDGKVGLILDRLASLTAQEDRLPKEFVSQAFNAILGLAGLIIAVTTAAAGVGAMYVNLQVGRLDRADEHAAEKLANAAPCEIELRDTDNGYGYGSVGDRPTDACEAFYASARQLVPDLIAEVRQLRTRRDELLAAMVRVANETPFADEAKDALAQRGKLSAEIGTLRAALEAKQ